MMTKTFRIFKVIVSHDHSEYRTHRFLLAIWNRMEAKSAFTAMGM